MTNQPLDLVEPLAGDAVLRVFLEDDAVALARIFVASHPEKDGGEVVVHLVVSASALFDGSREALAAHE